MDVDVHDHELGITWVVREAMQRASHALAAGGRVWFVDPVGHEPSVERALALGEPAGVIQLLDRHPRACADLAARFGVPHERLPAALPGTPFEVLTVVDAPRWREKALWWGDRRALVVAEAVGTPPYFTANTGLAGVHPLLRLLPPRGALGGHTPDHLLVGHGPPLHGSQAAKGLRHALDRSRTDAPRALLGAPFRFKAPAA